MAARFFRSRFFETLNILRGFALGQANRSPKLNRKIFYDDSIDLGRVSSYMKRLQRDASIMEDIAGLEMQLPDKFSDGGRAPWVSEAGFRRYVLGANSDYIVDPPAILETAAFVGADESDIAFIDGPGHNIMLGPRWIVGAQAVLNMLTKDL